MENRRHFLITKTRAKTSSLVLLLSSLLSFCFTSINANANVPDETGLIDELGNIIGLAFDVEDIQQERYWYGGFYRGFNYYVPPNAKADAPMVIQLHAAVTGKTTMRIGLDIRNVADREGFVVMWPEGATDITLGLGLTNTWNGGTCCVPAIILNVDDNGYLRNAIDRISAKVSIDESRIYAYGVSNGGTMSHRIGLESADKIAAVAPIVYPLTDNFTWRIPESWKSNRKTPVMVMQSEDDFVVPYFGGPTAGNLWGGLIYLIDGAQKGRQNWADLNECGAYVEEPYFQSQPNGPYTQTHHDCAQGTTVSLFTFKQGGHGPLYPFLNGGIDLKEELWNFFKDYRKPGSGSDHLVIGQELTKGQFLISDDRSKRLKLDPNGDLELKNLNTGASLWRTNTSDSSADRLVLQHDGNLVLYADGYWGWKKKKVWFSTYYVWSYFDAQAVWASNTNGVMSGEPMLNLSHSGELALSLGGQVVWTAN